MEPRISDANALLPEIQEVAGALVRVAANGSLPPATVSLVYLRAGQIVGNTYQVIRHSNDLRRSGEPEQRIAGVASWWDAPCYTEAERAALALTDAALQPNPRGAERVPDDTYDEVAKHYDDKAMATLITVVASAGFWMTIAVLLKPPAAGQGAAAA